MRDVQVDSQLRAARFPVLLAPSPVDGPARDFIHVSVARQKSDSSIDHFKYAAVLVQAMDLNVDEDVLVAVSEVYANMSRVSFADSDTAEADEALLRARFELQEIIEPPEACQCGSLVFR